MTLQPYPTRISSYSVIFNLLPVAGLEPACKRYILGCSADLLPNPLSGNKKGPQSEDRGPDKSSAKKATYEKPGKSKH